VAICTDEYCGGGGVWLAGSAPLNDNTIEDNESYVMGGGVYLYSSSGDVIGNLIEGNVCHNDGGGLYSYLGTGYIAQNEFTGNDAWDDAGGLRVMTGWCTIEDNVISYNTASDDGGGVKFSHAMNTFDRNHVEGNETGDEGGGLELDNDITPVLDCTFIENRSGRGAGIHSGEAWGDLLIADTVLEDNVASDRGGAIQFEEDVDADMYLVRVTAVGNEANYGGGICVSDSRFYGANIIAYDNQASSAGGGFYLDGLTGSLTNSVAYDNRAPQGAGIAIADTASGMLVNNIVAENQLGSGVHVSGTAPTWTYNDVWGNAGAAYSGMSDPTGSQGNIAQDPDFVSPGSGDFELQGASPCVDAGSPAIEDVDHSRSDMGVHGGPEGDW